MLWTLKAWEDPVFCKERVGLDAPLGSIDRSKLNVNGSSLAAGHPFAATGGRIVANPIGYSVAGKQYIAIAAGQSIFAFTIGP